MMSSKKFINDAKTVVDEMLRGIVLAHNNLKLLSTYRNVVVRADIENVKQAGLVSIVSGGGSGHEPAHAGYVGKSMLSAAVAGQVFASPAVDAILAAIQAVSTPRAGCLLVVKNYTGDIINFGLAMNQARVLGIPCEMLVVNDDVALASEEDPDWQTKARGIAGTVLIHKIVGAAAQSGLDLQQVLQVGKQAVAAVSTIGAALSPCTLPGNVKPNFSLGDDEMEIGLGIHGEAGRSRCAVMSAQDLCTQIVDNMMSAKPQLRNAQEVVLLINNLGSSTNMELYVLTNSLVTYLESRYGIIIQRVYCGAFLTALEMSGVSVSILQLPENDAEKTKILEYLDEPTESLVQFNPFGRGPANRSRPRSRGVEFVYFQPQEENQDVDSVLQTSVDSAISEQEQVIVQKTLDAIRAAHKTIEERCDEFNALDAEVGDGDLGTTLLRGSSLVVETLDNLDSSSMNLQRLLFKCAVALQGTGGSSGPLLAAFLLAMAHRFGQSANQTINSQMVGEAILAGTSAIQELGRAKRGDKTMLDVLQPIGAALQSGSAVPDAIRIGHEAAEGTKEMVPRKGRAQYLRERAVGKVDPGAFAMAILAQTVATCFK